jgi:hypothetical protein
LDSPLTLDEQLRAELNEWRKLGVDDPARVFHPPAFIQAIKHDCLLTLLLKKGIVTQEEIEESYKKEMLEQLQEGRPLYIEARKKALGIPNLIIPRNGKIQ